MRYVEPVFRPPSEAQSLILQVTVGCSHNACSFCAMYRSKRFQVRPLDELREEIAEAARDWPDTRRVFLGDGDGLAAPTALLLEVLRELKACLPRLRRVSIYATPMNLRDKGSADLRELRGAGLDLYYLGLESGSDEVLRAMGKGCTWVEAVDAVSVGRGAGLRSSVMVLLGLGGVEGSAVHAEASARAVNAMQPEFLSVLTWYPVPEAPLYRRMAAGRFRMPGDEAILDELALFVAGLELRDTVFRANHASNPLPVGGRLSRDKKKLLAALDAARRGLIPMRPLSLRGT